MEIKIKTVAISDTAVETGLWHIQRTLMEKYGCDTAERDMYPLHWYVGTGRASLDFLRKLLTAKPFMVARKLHMGGSDDEILQRIKKYIGYTEAC